MRNHNPASNREIAIDAEGNINVVWVDNTYGNDRIFYARSTDGGSTFSAPKDLSNDSGRSADPQIVLDGNGNVYVVWQDDTGNPSYNYNIFFTESTDGGLNFSTPQNLSESPAVSLEPVIAVDSSGNVNVAWQNYAPGNFDVFFSHSADGGVDFSAPENLSNDSGDSSDPQMVVDSTGDIDIVWDDGTAGGFLDIFFARSTDGGSSFSTPLDISNNSGISNLPQIALDSGGGIDIIWHDYTVSSSHSDIYFSRSTDGGSTFPPPKNISNTPGGSASPLIAVSSQGNICVIWLDYTTGNPDIDFTHSTDGGNTFSAAQNLSNDSGYSFVPQIAVGSNGNVDVVWEDNTGRLSGATDIYFRRSADGGNTFSATADLTNDSSDSSDPQIAMDGSYHINIIWSDTGPDNADIFYTRGNAVSPTTTTLTSSANPSLLGQVVTVTATVTAALGGTPTGSVTFTDGTTTLATVSLGSGAATFTASSLALGAHSITAAYSGGPGFTGSTASLTQKVTYGICALYNQGAAVQSGAVFPIKVMLCDVNGNDLSTSAVTLHATGITLASTSVGTPESPGSANPDSDFRFDSTLGISGGYIYNLSTQGLAPGTYSLHFTVTGDPVTHSVTFGVL